MGGVINNLWLIPALPLVAAGLTALLPRRQKRLAASLAIGSMGVALLLSLWAFAATFGKPAQGDLWRQFSNFTWLQMGSQPLQLGWVLDPLSAIMLVMVSLVGALIFIYSVGYMAHDENFTRFFCFLSLFAAAMLGLVIANSLLLMFVCWELVGLASYLLIGFWYQKPSAAAAAKKAFIVTRIGDLGFLLGMLWLYAQTGTLLFYDKGQGCLEQTALAKLAAQTLSTGMAVSTAISLLIFCGAVGKSGQLPLHVWLPDAMEGPTAVSALIHAATMVAAGVFLVARVYPLMSAVAPAAAGGAAVLPSTALQVVTWVGALTAVFAALIAIAQTDIKRILAYSTVSQLGYMMLGIGVGGYAVGMFHLITHAFFKALLFLGAGSVIHGCHEEQDIRRMGGLRRLMPVTFATYAVGMMALCGVPFLFSGFWSKDEILHRAMLYDVTKWPFYLAALGAVLTAFYMTRQMCYVFFGENRTRAAARPDARGQGKESKKPAPGKSVAKQAKPAVHIHESPPVMTLPLRILAGFAIVLGFIGTPFWPWFDAYLNGHLSHVASHVNAGVWLTMLLSIALVTVGVWTGWWLYGRARGACAAEQDALETLQPDVFEVLRRKFFVDEFYEGTVVKLNTWAARACDWLDQFVWNGLVWATAYLALGASWLSRAMDDFVVNLGFDQGCESFRLSGKGLSRLQNGQVQRYLRIIGLGLVVLAVVLIWGWKG